MPLRYEMIAATDIGQVREINEDSLRIVPDINLAVVADGMGGHQAGEVASRLAVESLCEYVQEQMLVQDTSDNDINTKIMTDAFAIANRKVYVNAREGVGREGMGTTLVASLFRPDAIHIGHIGDSRLYRFQQGSLEQITTDHTLATELGKKSPAADLPAYAHHVLRKALGIELVCEPDFITIEPKPNQIYIMCSDGLTGMLSDHDIQTLLALRSHKPEDCITSLIRASNDNGGPDNISVILIFTKS